MKTYYPRPNEKGYNTLTVVHAATGIPVIIGFISTDFELADFWDSPEGMAYNMSLLNERGDEIYYLDDQNRIRNLIEEDEFGDILIPQILETKTLCIDDEETGKQEAIGYLYVDGSVQFSNTYNDFLDKKIENVEVGPVIGNAWIQTTIANGK